MKENLRKIALTGLSRTVVLNPGPTSENDNFCLGPSRSDGKVPSPRFQEGCAQLFTTFPTGS